jgi:hypothetical protein
LLCHWVSQEQIQEAGDSSQGDKVPMQNSCSCFLHLRWESFLDASRDPNFRSFADRGYIEKVDLEARGVLDAIIRRHRFLLSKIPFQAPDLLSSSRAVVQANHGKVKE